MGHAEARVVAQRPCEIVPQRPLEESAQIHVRPEGALRRRHVVTDMACRTRSSTRPPTTPLVPVQAVFGDAQRQSRHLRVEGWAVSKFGTIPDRRGDRHARPASRSHQPGACETSIGYMGRGAVVAQPPSVQAGVIEHHPRPTGGKAPGVETAGADQVQIFRPAVKVIFAGRAGAAARDIAGRGREAVPLAAAGTAETAALDVTGGGGTPNRKSAGKSPCFNIGHLGHPIRHGRGSGGANPRIDPGAPAR